MKHWKLVLIGGSLGFLIVKALIINPLMERSNDLPEKSAVMEDEVTMTDQDGRVVSVNEIMRWKPEVDIK